MYTPRPAAYGVIQDSQGSFACVEEASGLFLPGGGAQGIEAPEATVVREVREECAFEVSRLERIGFAEQFFISRDGLAYQLQATFFRAVFGRATGGSPELELCFLDLDQARLRLFHECHRWALDVAFAA